jgi:hypothetical protein
LAEFLQLFGHPFALGLSTNDKVSLSAFPHVMGKAQESEGRRTLPPILVVTPFGIAAKSDKSRLAGFYFQAKGRQALLQFWQKSSGVGFIPEAAEKVVGIANHVRVCSTSLLIDPFEPPIEHVMQVDVRQYRRNEATLWCTLLRGMEQSIFQHSGLKESMNRA